MKNDTLYSEFSLLYHHALSTSIKKIIMIKLYINIFHCLFRDQKATLVTPAYLDLLESVVDLEKG